MGWGGHVASNGDRRGGYRFLVGRSEGKGSFGRPRCSWENNIKMYLLEVVWGMDWIQPAQDRDRWLAVVDRPLFSIKRRTFLD
jgi:hypothetical protein